MIFINAVWFPLKIDWDSIDGPLLEGDWVDKEGVIATSPEDIYGLMPQTYPDGFETPATTLVLPEKVNVLIGGDVILEAGDSIFTNYDEEYYLPMIEAAYPNIRFYDVDGSAIKPTDDADSDSGDGELA